MYSRKNLLEIHGVPREACPSTEEVVLKIADAHDVDIDSRSIEIAQTQRKNSDAIIFKFHSHKDKVKMYKSHRKLKTVNVSTLFPNCPLEAERDFTFLFENLTEHMRYVVNKANKMWKDSLLHSVWTMDSKIFITTSP